MYQLSTIIKWDNSKKLAEKLWLVAALCYF